MTPNCSTSTARPGRSDMRTAAAPPTLALLELKPQPDQVLVVASAVKPTGAPALNIWLHGGRGAQRGHRTDIDRCESHVTSVVLSLLSMAIRKVKAVLGSSARTTVPVVGNAPRYHSSVEVNP
eukprot:CAMPEP_0180531426 /NCGR_PEP_ID=MMETSP1036_2-20121128/62492_1 /TAXON_ID=632150 /ORGANISM="Azadinium spinosum, Strain 3D9" /LENGTH=122 /DNA_ID=CAMNT_0022545385 /DNA_START=198 /DNA_END=567 /DNA_ORIENTATION=+